MITLPVDLSEACRRGLRPSVDNDKNTPYLIECFNAMPYKDGLRSFKRIIDPFKGEIPDDDRAWPFPQLFKGKEVTLLCDEANVYEVSDTPSVVSDFDITDVYVYKYDDLDTMSNIPAGSQWHFIDLWSAWMLFNGSCIVFKDNKSFAEGAVAKVATDVSIRTGCEFRGRIVTGGFSQNHFWLETWRTLFENYRSHMASEFANMGYNVKDNFVIYSSIGQSDLAFRWLLYPSEAQVGLTDNSGFTARATGPFVTEHARGLDKTLLMQMIERNEFGIVPMPWQGRVHVVKAIGESDADLPGAVIVYGEGGVTALVSRTQPVPTFGVKHLLSVGIKCRSAVGGDDNMHVFVDETGCVWSLDKNLKLTPLGYEEFFKNESEIVVVPRTTRHEQRFYISTRDRAFTLTEEGLGEQGQKVMSSVIMGGEEVGTTIGGEDEQMIIVTDVQDNRTPGIKRVSFIEVSGEDVSDVLVAVDWRMKGSDPFERTDWTPVDDRGVATVIIAGVEFRFCIRNVKGKKINGWKYWWQLSDKRSFVGPDSAPFQEGIEA